MTYLSAKEIEKGISNRLSDWGHTHIVLHSKAPAPIHKNPRTKKSNKKVPSKNNKKSPVKKVTKVSNGRRKVEESSEESSTSEEEVDYKSYTVVKLRKILKERGLDWKGNKNQLIDRLVEDDNRSSSESGEEESESGSFTGSEAGSELSSEESSSEESSEEEIDYNKYKVLELRKLLEKRKLDTKGLKKQLVDRLIKDDKVNIK